MDDDMQYAMMNSAGEDLITPAFQELLAHYLSTRHRKRIEIINRAFNFANQAHRGIKRPNGEPYMLHPIAVARIVCDEIGLGSTSIAAALLHDVIEDTDYTVEDLENIFGPKIAQIVDGLNKIAGGIFGEQASTQAESLKELLLTMSADIRVVLIKMADRLHNMRTLSEQPEAKQMKISGETLYLYAPLAERLGLYKIKTELENLSFRYEHPAECRSIEAKIAASAATRDDVFRQFTAPIREQLDRMGLTYRITDRVKSAYSIWHKMQTKQVGFDEVYDLLAVRIIFKPRREEEELNDCFDIYVALTKLYKSHPDRLRDWVNHPKANGYQALHVTLMSAAGQWIEVQIRSERMHEIAEQGLAAHWKYKDRPAGTNALTEEEELNHWLLTIKDLLDDPGPEAIDFLDTIKLNLFASEIFVFTPKGDLKTMPQGATVLDFAFSLHTDIGTHCIGAKVNHKLVPLSHALQSGDQVEILTSRTGRVRPEWMDYATTARARAKISATLRRETKAHRQEGERLLADFLQQAGGRPDDRTLDSLTALHHYHTRDELLVAIGDGSLTLSEADRTALRGRQSGWKGLFGGGKKKSTPTVATAEADTPIAEPTEGPLRLTEERIAHDYRMATCCHPIPGDEVLGYVDEEGHVEIHKRACPVAIGLKSNYGRRIIAAQWDTHKSLTFPAHILIRGIDCVGLINQVTQVISCRLGVNIRRLNIEAGDGIFEGRIELHVHDVDDVRQVCRELKQIANIKSVSREM